MQYLPTRMAPSTLERIVTRIYDNRLRALLVFVIIMGLDILGTALMPRQYESRMKILVRNDRPDLVVSPDSTIARPADTLDITESHVNSEIEILKNYDLL